MKLKELYQELTQSLAVECQELASVEAEWILCFVLSMSRTNFFLSLSEEVTESKELEIKKIVKERLRGKPLAYSLGSMSFMGREFSCREGVLIPRPETELLIEKMTQALIEIDSAFIGFECGSGTGILPITLAIKYPKSIWYSWDIDKNANECAKENAKKFNVEDRVTFIHGDFFESDDYKKTILKDNPLVFVSNPPYISDKEWESDVENSVKEFESEVALRGGKDGLLFYKKFVPFIKEFRPTVCGFEMSYSQKSSLAQLFGELGCLEFFQDYQGLDRGCVIS